MPSNPANTPIIAFEGAILTRVIPQPARPSAFAFEVTFYLQHPRLLALSNEKPPLHFHPYQEEYIEVLSGRLGLEVDGNTVELTSESGEALIKPYAHHRLFPPEVPKDGYPPAKLPPGSKEAESEAWRYGVQTVFLLSGEDVNMNFRLDTIFFQNWYGYQDEVVIQKKPIDLIQVMCMFDAGGSYLSLPWWLPFGRTVSMAVSIFLGRWIGGLLGYQPYYRKWTTDWSLACSKMEFSLVQRRFADRAKTE